MTDRRIYLDLPLSGIDVRADTRTSGSSPVFLCLPWGYERNHWAYLPDSVRAADCFYGKMPFGLHHYLRVSQHRIVYVTAVAHPLTRARFAYRLASSVRQVCPEEFFDSAWLERHGDEQSRLLCGSPDLASVFETVGLRFSRVERVESFACASRLAAEFSRRLRFRRSWRSWRVGQSFSASIVHKILEANRLDLSLWSSIPSGWSGYCGRKMYSLGTGTCP